MTQRITENVTTFSPDNIPVATATAGEILVFETQDCFANQIREEKQLVHEIDFSKVNPAAGPVFIEEAEVGDVLVVDVLDIQVGPVGFACTIDGQGPLNEGCDVRTRLFEVKDGKTSFNGEVWPISPMIGVIGTAPAEGSIPTGFPGNHGGNMDSPVIAKGTRLYFPVRTKGALLQMGDLHASMGDGELSGTGIEISGEVTVRVNVIKDYELHWPVTQTQDRLYVNTTGADFEEALVRGTEEMYRLMKPVYGWDRTDTAIYFTVRGDIELNQATRPREDDVELTARFSIPHSLTKDPIFPQI